MSRPLLPVQRCNTVKSLEDAFRWTEHNLAVLSNNASAAPAGLEGLAKVAHDMAHSSAFSGVGAPEAALGMVLRRLGDAVGTTLRCENKFAIEKREESRVELMCHDCAPTCVFEDMMDFVNPKVRRVLESQGARMKFDDIVKIFKSGMAIKSKARCRIHCKECDALYCRLHTAGTPCVVWSPQGPQVGVDDLEFLLCFLA
eukprot:6198863-Pyramimonas_sp.AAC.1